jgi:hypothetical protein
VGRGDIAGVEGLPGGSVADPGSSIRDPGWVKSQDPDPGSGMNKPDRIS